MSQDGSHLQKGIVTMLGEYGFQMCESLEANLKQFTNLGENNILRYAAYGGSIYNYQLPTSDSVCAVYVDKEIMYMCNGRLRMVQGLSQRADPRVMNATPGLRRLNGEDELDGLCLFILGFFGIDILSENQSQLSENLAALRNNLQQTYPVQQHSFLRPRISDTNLSLQTKRSPFINENIDVVDTQDLFNPDNLEVNNERVMTKTLSDAARTLQMGGALQSANIDEQNDRNMQIVRGAIGWYMLIKVVLQQPTIMRLMSLPNVENIITKKGIKVVGPGLQTLNPEQTVQQWLNIVYVDVTEFVKVADPLSNSLGDVYKQFLQQIQLDSERVNTAAKADESHPKFFMNVERLSFYFERFVNRLIQYGRGEAALILNSILSIMQKWLKQMNFAGDFLNTLVDSLKETSQTETQSDILTYVRLTSRPPNVYNRRFDVRVSPSSLYVGYRNDDIKFYGEDLQITQEFQELASRDPDVTKTSTDIEIKSYPYRYLFGPFTHVLLPNLTNQDCALQCKEILDCLKKKQSVFLIGYGASGAGKTSSLIYLNNIQTKPADRDGVLIHLCHHSDIINQYDELYVSVNEIYVSQHDEQSGQSTQRKFQYKSSEPVGREERDKLRLTKNQNNKFAVADDVIYQNAVISGEKQLQHLEMGEVVLHLLDKDRKVSATTNNPVSSRSHVLVFVRLCSKQTGDSAPYLIVGDFAGVENKFNCESWDVLNRFRKSGKLVNGAVERYYGQPHEGDDCQKLRVPQFTSDVNTNDLEAYLNNTDLPDGDPIHIAYQEMQAKLPNFGQYSNERLKDFPAADFDQVTKFYKEAQIDQDDRWILQAMIPNLPVTNILDSIQIYEDPERSGELRPVNFIDQFNRQVEKFFSEVKWSGKIPSAVKAAYLITKLVPFGITTEIIDQKWLEQLLKDLRFLPAVAEEEVSVFGIDFKDLKQWTGVFTNPKPTNFNFNKIRAWIKQHKLFNFYSKLQKTSLTLFMKNLLLMRIRLMQSKFDLMTHVIQTDGKFLAAKQQLETYFEQICKCRTREGVFINSSLKDTRNVIAALIVKQSQAHKTIRVIPPFFDTCMYMQCRPLSGSCYNNSDMQTKAKDSAMFQAIQNQFKLDRADTSIDNLKIAIFSVLNLSRDANNPPHTPYIDMEDIKLEMDRISAIEKFKNIQVSSRYQEILKQNSQKLNIEFRGTSSQELLLLLKRLLLQQTPLTFDSNDLDTDFETGSLRLAEAYTEQGKHSEAALAHAAGCIAVERKFLQIAQKFHQSDEQSIDQKQLEILSTMITRFSSKIGTDLVKTIQDLIMDLKQRFEPDQAALLISLIDNYNATSAIGTLEFTDRMAKYAMTDKTCRISDTSLPFIKGLQTSMNQEIRSLLPIAQASRNY